MNAAWVEALASVGTFCVVATSAVVALRQLRHMRNGNQIAVFTELRNRMNEPAFREAFRFVREELAQRQDDPAFRRRVLDDTTPEAHQVLFIGNFLDGEIAPLVKHDMVDRELACDLFYFHVTTCWEALGPYIARQRETLGYRMWEEFEYLALLCKEFRARHPDGTYPKGAPAVPLPQAWPDYETSGKSHSTTSPSPEISSEDTS